MREDAAVMFTEKQTLCRIVASLLSENKMVATGTKWHSAKLFSVRDSSK